MREIHQHEQYFFDALTLTRLADFLSAQPAVACLCAPLLGQCLAERHVPVAILDIDERFASVPGFHRYDVYRPERLEREFSLIVCDPPFFNVSLSQLFNALRVLSHYNFAQPLLVAYLRRRASAILGTFAPFGLQPTGFIPTYLTVQPTARNTVEFFSNLPAAQLKSLQNESGA